MPWERAKDFGLYPEGKGKLLKGFKPGDDTTRITVWKERVVCSVENGLEVREPGARLSDEEAAAVMILDGKE